MIVVCLSAECIINFSLWFAGSLSSVTHPVAGPWEPSLADRLVALTTSKTPQLVVAVALWIVFGLFFLLLGF